MTVTRGLIIADPWIDHILNGRKDWEMRSQATSIRGWFGLIRKGSGSVVGLARLRDCGMALNQTEMIANFDHHRIPVDMIRRGRFRHFSIPRFPCGPRKNNVADAVAAVRALWQMANGKRT